MKIYKSFLMMALLAVTAAFTACSDEGYWDEAPASSEAAYSFEQATQTISLSGSDVLTEIQVPVMRATTAGQATLPVTAEFNDETLTSAQAEVTFEAGSNKAIYTIKVGEIAVGKKYTATLTFPEEQKSVSGNSSITISISKAYTWVSAGSAQFWTSWSGLVDDSGAPVGEGATVAIEHAEGSNGLYRLVQPYFYTESSGVTPGGHIQFYVDPATGAAQAFGATVQPIGQQISGYGNIYFIYSPSYGHMFLNDGSFYMASAYMGYDEGGSSVSAGWYETVYFDWNVGYPW